MKSITYFGGKQRLAPKILPFLPPHTLYAEPFAGGLALLFLKPIPNCAQIHYMEAVNDLNEYLISFYRTLQDPKLLFPFITRVQATPFSFQEYQKAQTDPDKAWAFFVSSQQSFAASSSPGIPAGWAFSTKRNHPELWINKLSSLFQMAERLQSVYVDNQDALSFIQRWDSPHTTFYIDPPYPNTSHKYSNSFSLKKFKLLIDLLLSIKASFVLSAYPEPVQHLIPDTWIRRDFQQQVAASKHHSSHATEAIWIVNRANNMEDDLKVVTHVTNQFVNFRRALKSKVP